MNYEIREITSQTYSDKEIDRLFRQARIIEETYKKELKLPKYKLIVFAKNYWEAIDVISFASQQEYEDVFEDYEEYFFEQFLRSMQHSSEEYILHPLNQDCPLTWILFKKLI